ncbi:hypothetical protein ABGB07_02380 [Micromonosporaceae bacterium B7E4]
MGFKAGWSMAMMFLFAALVGAGSILYANHVAADSERKWCNVVTTMDDAYRAAPPVSPIGQKLARDIGTLRSEFHCPPRGPVPTLPPTPAPTITPGPGG